jgi:hypothetical protein
MRNLGLLIFFIYMYSCVKAQPYNRVYLLGYYGGLTNARLVFDSASYQLIPETRNMPFMASQATISDSAGNLLISTNGCWIADSTGNTMQNGSGLIPGTFSNDWCTNSSGQPLPTSSVLLPAPGLINQYYLIHLTGEYSNATAFPRNCYYSTINLNLNGGLGAVVQKNISFIQDSLCPVIAVCKHANGRDWWITLLKDSSDLALVFLLDPSGINLVSTQHLGYSPHDTYNGQPAFSPDGTKFAYHFWTSAFTQPYDHQIRLLDFDRCSGLFSNPDSIELADSSFGFGLSFSANSKYLYWCSYRHIYQLNTDTTDVAASQQLVAINDGYYSPQPPYWTDFWLMYLAANGKIYISSGNSVVDMHYIDYSDSAGVACGVQQHALPLPCLSVRTHVNHPNYSLGPVTGSVCDSLGVGITELDKVRNFTLRPNPVKSGGTLTLHYELPQNKSGELEIRDALGRMVYGYPLPPWSNMQNLHLPLLTPGIYLCTIRSLQSRMSLKLVLQ